MNSQTNKPGLLPGILLVTGLPIFFYATGDFPRRTLLKESISLLTIVSFFLVLAQFFLTRSGNSLLLRDNTAKVIKVHKILGYVFVCVFLVHPFFIVLPRYFEAGVEPAECLITILSTYNTPGVLSGIFAWCLMFILLGTAISRKKFPLSYKTWVAVHKWLSITFIFFYTQVGSSLAGSAVQGAVAGVAAADYCKTVTLQDVPKTKRDELHQEILAPLERKAGYSPAWVTQTLQGIMIPNFVLYIKKEKLLQAALAYVEELRDHHIPMLRAADFHELRLAHETTNMIISAEMKLKASIMRKESRCSHYRLDYPEMDNTNWRAWINIYKGTDGSMQLEKQSFSNWPA